MIFLTCSRTDFAHIAGPDARWLQPDSDYELAKAYWEHWKQPLSHATWAKAHEFGYRHAARTAERRTASTAGVWRFSEEAWEVVAVSTLEDFRRKGFAQQLVAFVTAQILGAGRLATCSTRDDNGAMVATAKSVGYQVVPTGQIWWTYPQLPDF